MANKKPAAKGASSKGRFAYEGLHRTIHEKARLGIMASLATHPDGLLFTDLKQLCSLTDGNLNRHLQVLHDARLVELWKGGPQRRSQTMCRLTRHGREALLGYLTELEQVVADAAAVRMGDVRMRDGEASHKGGTRNSTARQSGEGQPGEGRTGLGRSGGGVLGWGMSPT